MIGVKHSSGVPARPEFKPGIHRHYKGGLYTAICLVTHHETREPMVLYVSHTKGTTNVRPLHGWAGDNDGWDDYMPEHKQHRFEFVEELAR